MEKQIWIENNYNKNFNRQIIMGGNKLMGAINTPLNDCFFVNYSWNIFGKISQKIL
jgi:hypothetical protein